MASISKTFTAAAVVQLRDRGRLTLDDPLVRHLPEFGAVRALRAPLPMCEVEVVETYASREDELGCRNPEFHELPRERANFRIFAVVAD